MESVAQACTIEHLANPGIARCFVYGFAANSVVF
jgi:hypothetical protein